MNSFFTSCGNAQNSSIRTISANGSPEREVVVKFSIYFLVVAEFHKFDFSVIFLLGSLNQFNLRFLGRDLSLPLIWGLPRRTILRF